MNNNTANTVNTSNAHYVRVGGGVRTAQETKVRVERFGKTVTVRSTYIDALKYRYNCAQKSTLGGHLLPYVTSQNWLEWVDR
eukprot:UN13905